MLISNYGPKLFAGYTHHEPFCVSGVRHTNQDPTLRDAGLNSPFHDWIAWKADRIRPQKIRQLLSFRPTLSWQNWPCGAVSQKATREGKELDTTWRAVQSSVCCNPARGGVGKGVRVRVELNSSFL